MPDLDFSPIRPRLARLAAGLVGTLVALGTGVLIVLPAGILPRWTLTDRFLVVLAGGVAAALIYRQGAVAAFPSAAGLRVRNLVFTRELAWAEIVRVSFAPGRAWAYLDLSDGETLAVMAIQSADGKYARSQARRLAALVARHEGAE